MLHGQVSSQEIGGLSVLINFLNEMKEENLINNFGLDRTSLTQVFSEFAKHQVAPQN